MAKKAKAAASRIKSILAIANLQPPLPGSLYVRARVSVPNPGCTATLKRAVPQGINPKILILDVVVKQRPGIWPQLVVDVDADFIDRRFGGKQTHVTVRFGRESKTKKILVVV
jgi:hypothetical protein